MFYRPAWEPCLSIHAWGHGGKDSPEYHQNWDSGEYCDKDCEVETTAELKRYEPWDGYQQEEEESVGPGIISCTISRQRSIFDSRRLQSHIGVLAFSYARLLKIKGKFSQLLFELRNSPWVDSAKRLESR